MAKKPEAAADVADEFHHPALTIRCTQPGFRRGGVAHPDEATYPADTFTRDQLVAFDAEPRLILTPAETI